jgi:hypothetical protein
MTVAMSLLIAAQMGRAYVATMMSRRVAAGRMWPRLSSPSAARPRTEVPHFGAVACAACPHG